MFNIPADLAKGSYQLTLETWFSTNSTQLKQSRTLTYAIPLVVGGTSGGGGDDRPGDGSVGLARGHVFHQADVGAAHVAHDTRKFERHLIRFGTQGGSGDHVDNCLILRRVYHACLWKFDLEEYLMTKDVKEDFAAKVKPIQTFYMADVARLIAEEPLRSAVLTSVSKPSPVPSALTLRIFEPVTSRMPRCGAFDR